MNQLISLSLIDDLPIAPLFVRISINTKYDVVMIVQHQADQLAGVLNEEIDM